MRRALLAIALLASTPALSADLASWPLLQNPFPSTGGGGVMIDGYRPVVSGEACFTDFQARTPDGAVYRSMVRFDAVPREGGILCTNGRWWSLESEAAGTTPFEVFIKDGVVRRAP